MVQKTITSRKISQYFCRSTMYKLMVYTRNFAHCSDAITFHCMKNSQILDHSLSQSAVRDSTATIKP